MTKSAYIIFLAITLFPSTSWSQVYKINHIGVDDTYSSGTCFYIKQNLVLTAAHVVNQSNAVTLVFLKEKVAIGKILLLDKEADLAIIETEEISSYYPMAKEDNVIGDKVKSYGPPKVVNGFQDFKKMTLVDSNILVLDNNFTYTTEIPYSGRSGSPLLNSDNQTIGVCSAVITDVETGKQTGQFVSWKQITNLLLRLEK